MTCVACGYQPTERKRLDQPYACPKCEPETWRPSLAEGLKDCFRSLTKETFDRCAAQVPFWPRQQRLCFKESSRMSFADSMDDLEAMNDPRNTAESVAARRSEAKLGWIEALFAWLPLAKKNSARLSSASKVPATPNAHNVDLAQQQVIADLDQSIGTRSSAMPTSGRKVS